MPTLWKVLLSDHSFCDHFPKLIKDHLRHELEGTVLVLAKTKEQNRQQHAETSNLIKQLERDRIAHQTEIASQKNEFENRCRDLENEFENRLNEQIADGLRRRQNLLDEFNKCTPLLSIIGSKNLIQLIVNSHFWTLRVSELQTLKYSTSNPLSFCFDFSLIKNLAQDQMKSRLNELKRERDGYDAKIAEKEKHMKSIEAELRAVKANSFDGNRKPTDKAITRQQRFRYFVHFIRNY